MLPLQQKKNRTTAPKEQQHNSNVYLHVPICQQPTGLLQNKSYKLLISQQNMAISPLDQPPSIPRPCCSCSMGASPYFFLYDPASRFFGGARHPGSSVYCSSAGSTRCCSVFFQTCDLDPHPNTYYCSIHHRSYHSCCLMHAVHCSSHAN